MTEIYTFQEQLTQEELRELGRTPLEELSESQRLTLHGCSAGDLGEILQGAIGPEEPNRELIIAVSAVAGASMLRPTREELRSISTIDYLSVLQIANATLKFSRQ